MLSSSSTGGLPNAGAYSENVHELQLLRSVQPSISRRSSATAFGEAQLFKGDEQFVHADRRIDQASLLITHGVDDKYRGKVDEVMDGFRRIEHKTGHRPCSYTPGSASRQEVGWVDDPPTSHPQPLFANQHIQIDRFGHCPISGIIRVQVVAAVKGGGNMARVGGVLEHLVEV